MKQPTLKQAVEFMDKINFEEADRFNSYFEGVGNGNVKLIIENKFMEIINERREY